MPLIDTVCVLWLLGHSRIWVFLVLEKKIIAWSQDILAQRHQQ